jgi:hypothetical protein
MPDRGDLEVFQELREIGSIIESAQLFSLIRNEVKQQVKNAQVTEGKYSPFGHRYDIVISKCELDIDGVTRRLQASIPNVKVDRLVDGVLGVRVTRNKK